VKLDSPCERMDLELYGPGNAQVRHLDCGPHDQGWVRLDLGSDHCRSLPNGLYYCSVTAHRGPGETARCFGKVMVLH
jgi:hypothetical protein